MSLLYLAAAGFAGAVARYWLSGYVARKTGFHLPWGTMAVNLSGTLVLGLLAGLSAGSGGSPPNWYLPAVTGFLGAYTTFSTWQLETLQLLKEGRWPAAVMNIALSSASGLAAAAIGLAIGRRVGA